MRVSPSVDLPPDIDDACTVDLRLARISRSDY